MIAATLDRFGRLDLAINNAAIEGLFAPIVDFPDEAWDQTLAINLRRTGQPEEIASVIAFHCSGGASYLTGASLVPDGGYTLTVS